MLDRYYNAITKSADLWVRCFGVDDISRQTKLQSVCSQWVEIDPLLEFQVRKKNIGNKVSEPQSRYDRVPQPN